MKSKTVSGKLPQHVGIIMDGNGRWAQKRLMPRSVGHRQGVTTLKKIIDAAIDYGIPYLTAYAFSTENQKRDREEIDGIMRLIRKFFDSSLSQFVEKGVRIRILGDRSYFSDEIQEILRQSELQTASGTHLTAAFALNYGSRAELVRAVNSAVAAGTPQTEQSLARLLDTVDMPDPDMIIRTGGQMRLSNFLLYQSAYAELFFTQDLWPDFNKKKFAALLGEFSQRTRNFGK